MSADFARFTERARQVVVLAQDEAKGLKHNYIGAEHLLLGLLREEEGLAARVLNEADVTVEWCRLRIREVIGEGTEALEEQIPLTPRATKVCELALREALSLGHNYIGTEHLLLGLVRERGHVVERLLGEKGVDGDGIRNALIQKLTDRKPQLPRVKVLSTDDRIALALERIAAALERFQPVAEEAGKPKKGGGR